MDGGNTACFITLLAEMVHYLLEQLQSLFSIKYERKNQLYGLTTIIVIVTKAFDIPIPKKDAAPSVKVVYGEESECKETFDTRTVTDYLGTDPLSHYFNCAFNFSVAAAMLQQKRFIFD